jgi:hypothetical protein
MWDNKVVEMLNDNEKLVSFCKHEFTTQTKVVFPKVWSCLVQQQFLRGMD